MIDEKISVLKINDNETENEALWRIGCEKRNGLYDDVTWVEIANIFNKHFRKSEEEYYDPSAYRKKFKNYLDFYEQVINNGHNTDIQYVGTRILCVSDCHVPYELPINKLHEYIGKVDILVLNGDIGDCQAISTFPKTYRKSPMEEIIETRQYIISMIDYIKPKKVIINYGNHDLRFQSYMAKNLDSDLLELMPETSLELIIDDGFKHYDKVSKVKIEYPPIKTMYDDIDIVYTSNWYVQINDTIFCHPKAFSSGILKTAEKAMYFFRNEGMNFKTLVLAHTHRIGYYKIGNTMIYEQGAFCDVNANNYSDGCLVNSQKEGFIYICQDINGNTIESKTKLITLN